MSALRMSEAQLQSNVLELAALLGIRTAHFRPARTATGWRTAVSGDGKGFPDCVLVGTRVLFRELKADDGKPSAEQRGWYFALTRAGADVGYWTPDDWRSGRIEAVLRAISPKTPAAAAGTRIPREEP